MPFFTAIDDFRMRTLARIPGLLNKLEYVVGLRGADGEYGHWGLARVFGNTTAQQAVAETHRELATEVMRIPLAVLWLEAEDAGRRRGEREADYVAGLESRSVELAPSGFGAGSNRHFKAVLASLSALARERKAASRRVS